MGSRREPYKKRQRVDGVISDGREIQSRRCLGHCGQLFQPLHKWNHVCPECSEQNKNMNGAEFKIGRRV